MGDFCRFASGRASVIFSRIFLEVSVHSELPCWGYRKAGGATACVYSASKLFQRLLVTQGCSYIQVKTLC